MAELRLERRLTIRRPVVEVFRYLADFSRIAEWDPSVIEAQKEDPGPPEVGMGFSLKLRSLGRVVPMRYRLTALEAPERIALVGEGEGFSAEDEIHLAPDTVGTTLTYRALIRIPAVPGLAAPLLRSWGERLADATADGLFAALEDDGPETPGMAARLAERLVLPGAAAFTHRGYRAQRSRGLSRFMDGRCVALTGATGGLGLAAARKLAGLGAELILIGRDAAKLAAAAESVRAVGGPAPVHTLHADLLRLSEADRLAEALLSRFPGLDTLINNAGALYGERALTAEGFERAVAVNLLVPARLGERLAPHLAERRGRLINVLSGGLYLAALRLHDPHWERGRYDGASAYAWAKRGLLLHTQALAERHGREGLAVHALHPGWAATPGVAQSLPAFERLMRPWLRTPEAGADTMVWLASHPALGSPARGGRFWFDRAPRPTAVLPHTEPDTATRTRFFEWLDGSLRRAAA